MSRRTASQSELRLADIIVSTTNHPTSRSIRVAIGADISHAMLYIGNGDVIEATGHGVEVNPLERVALNGATLAIALRRTHMTDQLRRAVVENAKQFKGRSYDKLGAAGSGMTSKRVRVGVAAGCIISPIACTAANTEFSRRVAENANEENRDKMFFCSELVARAFELAGVPIVNGAATGVNPRAIKVSSQLQYVGHLRDVEPPAPPPPPRVRDLM